MNKNIIKHKIINDAVYGFITIKHQFVIEIIEHPFFQRLRRIHQLGLSHYVYPGATHTRFQHALGCLHLMRKALDMLKEKGHTITDEEYEASLIAILLHDIGHGPFSHTLEKSIVENLQHEEISLFFIEELNQQFNGKLDLSIAIFKDEYYKKFLHQLVSSQLDVDRLDYLRRDTFFTGVSEGVIGSERIIMMLNVVDDQLVVESKGINSIEKFLIARRLMYWQVYLHKTVLSAEYMMIALLKRAKEIYKKDQSLFLTPSMKFFIEKERGTEDFKAGHDGLKHFANLDDTDIFICFKFWATHEDKILSSLSYNILNRKLYKIEIQNNEFDKEYIEKLTTLVQEYYQIDSELSSYYLFHSFTKNRTYDISNENITILNKNGDLIDIAEASDQFNVTLLPKIVTKYFVCYPEAIRDMLKK